MGLKDDLIAAKALIDTPEKWGRERFADVVRGRYCIRGACAVATRGRFLGPEAEVLEVALARQMPGPFAGSASRRPYHLAQFNDEPTTTHADIMVLFDRAIAAA